MPRARFVLLICSALLLLGLSGGALWTRFADQQSVSRYVPLFQRVNALVRRNYVEPVEEEKLVDGALWGMVTSLDPESSILPDRRSISELLRLPGPPIVVVRRAGLPMILDVRAGAPEGLKAGDFIREIDGVPAGDMDQGTLLGRLAGTDGTAVTLVVAALGDAPRTIKLTRRTAPPDSLPHPADREGWWIWSPVAMNRSPDEIRASLARIPGDTRLVLDLRHATGDPCTEAEPLAGLFVAGGKPIGTLKVAGGPPMALTAPAASTPVVDPKDVVVWLSRATCRSGEVLANALLINGSRAVGETSAGQAYRRSLFPLDDGRSLELVTGIYLGANGEPFARHPLKPSVEAAADQDEKMWGATLSAPAP